MTTKDAPAPALSEIPARPGPAGEADVVQTVAARSRGDGRFVLRLYVASLTPRSVTAIQSITCLCETHLAGQYDLEIIDIYEQPGLAKGARVIAAPTLIKMLPLPLRRLIGDMADQERVLVGLDLDPGDHPARS